jgi:hypothetical protein
MFFFFLTNSKTKKLKLKFLFRRVVLELEGGRIGVR